MWTVVTVYTPEEGEPVVTVRIPPRDTQTSARTVANQRRAFHKRAMRDGLRPGAFRVFVRNAIDLRNEDGK